MEYIEEQPSGTPLRLKSLTRAARYNSDSETSTLIKGMLKDGLIQRYRSLNAPRKYTYTTQRQEKVTQEASIIKVSELAPAPDKLAASVVSAIETADKSPSSMFYTIEKRAKEFVWENNSDSVREFMVYLKGRI
jgi:DNA-binding MarR family transcriptional regulator